MGKCPEPTPPQQPTGESPLRAAYWAYRRFWSMQHAMGGGIIRRVPILGDSIPEAAPSPPPEAES